MTAIGNYHYTLLLLLHGRSDIAVTLIGTERGRKLIPVLAYANVPSEWGIWVISGSVSVRRP